MALTTQTSAEQVGRAYADAARGKKDVLELWVSAEPGNVHVWLISPPPYDPALAKGLRPIWRSGSSVLYSIEGARADRGNSESRDPL